MTSLSDLLDVSSGYVFNLKKKTNGSFGSSFLGFVLCGRPRFHRQGVYFGHEFDQGGIDLAMSLQWGYIFELRGYDQQLQFGISVTVRSVGIQVDTLHVVCSKLGPTLANLQTTEGLVRTMDREFVHTQTRTCQVSQAKKEHTFSATASAMFVMVHYSARMSPVAADLFF
jgi:hypothetical protein